MANEEQLSILNRGAKVWNQWREDNLAERIDLNGATLTCANLAGVTLTDAILAGATLYEADMTDADLTGAILTGATLTGADLTRADLTGADLKGATLAGGEELRARLMGRCRQRRDRSSLDARSHNRNQRTDPFSDHALRRTTRIPFRCSQRLV